MEDEVNKKNEEKELENKKIVIYNSRVDEIIKRMESYRSMEAYIFFEGVKYGMADYIHEDGDCFGIIREVHSMCNQCENGMYYCGGNNCGFYVDMCNKCDYRKVHENCFSNKPKYLSCR